MGRGEGGGGGGGGGGEGVRWWWCRRSVVRACLSMRTRMHPIDMDQRDSALVPSAGLTSRKNPYAWFLRRQVPGVPGANLTQLHGEEKDCEARPPHPPLLRRKGGAIFSISSALDALDLEYEKSMHLDVSSWLARPS